MSIKWIADNLSLGGLVKNAGKGVGALVDGACRVAAAASEKAIGNPGTAEKVASGFRKVGKISRSTVESSTSVVGAGLNTVVQKVAKGTGSTAALISEACGADSSTVETIRTVGTVVGAAGVGLVVGGGIADIAVAAGAAAGTAGAAATTSGLAALGGGSMAIGQAVAHGISGIGTAAGMTSLAETRHRIDRILKAANTPTQEAKAVEALLDKAPDQVRIIEGHEHWDLLLAAMSGARDDLFVLSGWLGSPITKPEVQHLIREALGRGVSVYVGFGWEGSNGHEMTRTAAAGFAWLERVAQESGPGHLHLKRFANHEKVLIVDDAYVVIGSNNWLSNTSFHNSERSVLIEDSRLARSEGSRIRSLFET